MAQTNVNASNESRRLDSEMSNEWSNLQDEAKSRVKQLASTTTDSLKRAGNYLKEHDFDSIASDVTRTVRRYSTQSVLVCLGVGYLIGRVIRRS